MSKKSGDNSQKKKISKKMTLAIRIVKSKKSGSYTFEKKMISGKEIKVFFCKKAMNYNVFEKR
ncbi:hypothetical protein K645_2486 [Blattabacterium sp. (Nauphoeta cinerea)]|uniref:DUF4295 family protein n=1 Tax=Blattabacterium sp. (Nauphoeta cinerea) TaxID=1316444 RepID=UPI0003B04D97|nr:DUF4295 family protein [Blattabacterium sp. (Nauphoeta cinerea)]AGW86276.1 hypothetical protein K645_2486 [Blattabacterium sp. (Nauphoeta cinerea)]